MIQNRAFCFVFTIKAGLGFFFLFFVFVFNGFGRYVPNLNSNWVWQVDLLDTPGRPARHEINGVLI
jgi:hypothetical protein